MERVDDSGERWRVVNAEGIPVTNPFDTGAQAVRFADLTGARSYLDVPMVLLPEGAEVECMPLFGAKPSAASVTS